MCICAALFVSTGRVVALETDQFTVPDRPLADIGPEMDLYVASTVWDVAQKLSARATAEDREAASDAFPFFGAYHRSLAARYRGADLLAKRVYDVLAGPGLPECKIEQWVRTHPFRAAGRDGAGQALFNLSLAQCVYGDSLFSKPPLLAYVSPTVNVHGAYVGVDKFGHLFQQGYDYYEEYRSARDDGDDEEHAAARAVRSGVGGERGIFGEALTGVYSNADLAANYAGLKFYLNLTRPVRIGDAFLPPLLLRDAAGNWCFNPDRRPAGLLRPFVDEHLNEALNPSRFEPVLRETVRENLRGRSERLLEFYGTTPQRERRRMEELATWHGENYGHSDRGLVTIADDCRPSDEVGGRGVVTAGSKLPSSASPDHTRVSATRLSTR